MPTPQEMRERILESRRDRKPQPIEVPEWGLTVWVRVLSAEDQVELAESDQRVMTGRILVAALVTEDGERIFSDDDVTELMKEDAPVIMRVFAFAAKVNGLSTKELEEAMDRFAPAPDEQRSTG